MGYVIIILLQILFDPVDLIGEKKEFNVLISIPDIPAGLAEVIYGHFAIKSVIHFRQIPASDVHRAFRARPRFDNRKLCCGDRVLKREITTENLPIGFLVIEEIIAGKIAGRSDGQGKMHPVPLGGEHPGIECNPGRRRNYHGQFRP